jgi:D-alanyl-D-alanine carboxypeptidase
VSGSAASIVPDDASVESTDCGAAATPRQAAALQSALDAAVATNRGKGGGVLRVASLACGVVWEGASGSRALGGAPMEPGDVFEVASITKTFTAAVVLQMAEEGRLDLDAPLAKLAPGLADGLLVLRGRDLGPLITPRQLLGHTSGLPDVWNDPAPAGGSPNPFVRAFEKEPERFWDPGDVLRYARRLAPVGAPGQRYRYSDTGYILLGLLVERLAGKPLHVVMRERILSALRMGDTWMSYREPPAAGIPEAHRYEDQLDLHGQRRQSADWASGGLVSSTRDLTRFARALASGRLFVNPATLDAMRAWHATGAKDVSYGLGLFRVQLDAGLGDLWGHDGHGNAFLYVWPQGGLVFAGTLDQTANDWWPLVGSAIAILDNERDAGAGDSGRRP